MQNSVDNELHNEHSGNFLSIETKEKTRQHRSSEGQKKTNTNSSSGFNVHRVYDKFSATLREHNNPKSPIGTQDYIDSYRELIKFVDQLGYIFKFVKDDVIEKLTILQSFMDKDKNDEFNYDTIQKAIDYETEHNLIKTNPDNFTRTLLRLHRALIFIVEFLRNLIDRPLSENTTTIATHCYDATLANHHSFLVRKSVRMGFLLLPSRRQLDDIIFHGQKSDLFDKYKTFVKIIQQIYDTIEALYAEKKYLQLP